MKGDFSRRTFDRAKHYSGVEMQQGRVQLDADWNEQGDIVRHQMTAEARDVIGPSGGPMFDAAFALVDRDGNPLTSAASLADVYLGRGRYYVDGVLCGNEAIVPLLGQPDFPLSAPPNDRYILYLDVWDRLVTALDDPKIREVALGGPDTAARRRTIWQAKLKAAQGDNCLTRFDGQKSTGLLTASLATPPANADDCVVPESVDYRSLENQLYRVEIHKPGPLETATFKWSRENGSIVTVIKSLDPNNNKKIVVADLGRDDVLGFQADDWVEITDEPTELAGIPGTLYQIDGAPDAVSRTITLKSVPTIDTNEQPKLRRWDQKTATAQGDIQTRSTNIALEFGVQVAFSATDAAGDPPQYNTGDYWLIPARTSNGDPMSGNVEWPRDNAKQPIPQLAAGIDHHYARIATIEWSNTSKRWTLTDCRRLFPPITELTSFYYLGGDGQEAEVDPLDPSGFIMLPAPLQVGVANGSFPIAGARVHFSVVQPSAGVLTTAPVNSTLVDPAKDGTSDVEVWTADGTAGSNKGVAAVIFKMDRQVGGDHHPVHGLQKVVATLLDAAGNPVQLPITFSATLERFAAGLSYAGGDGQEAHRGRCLPAPLRVLVSDEWGVIGGRRVQFAVESTNPKQFPAEQGTLAPGYGNIGGTMPLVVTTGADGIAECYWTPSANATHVPSQEWIAATLIDGTVPGAPESAIKFYCHDLSFHNRHLHGTGIVCGLQVYCGPNGAAKRTMVTVRNGYAIDSYGKDIIVNADDGSVGDDIDVLSMTRAAGLLHDIGDPEAMIDGSVSLTLRAGQTPQERYAVEEYDPDASPWQHVFDDTFWSDVYKDCIAPLLAELQLESRPEYRSVLLNLIAPAVYPQLGDNVFVSPREDAILGELFARLAKNLRSRTFCDLKNPDHFRPLPEYKTIFEKPDSTVRPSTIFGTKPRQRMRVDPEGRYAVVMGDDDLVQLFDLENGVFAGESHFPTAGAVVQDAAFSKNNDQIFVFAVTPAGATFVASASIGGAPIIAWSGAAAQVSDFSIARVEYSTGLDQYFGIGLGRGLFLIDPRQVQLRQIGAPFNALGHLTISEKGQSILGYATVNDGSGRYAQVVGFDLRKPSVLGQITLPAPGNDDIAAAQPSPGQQPFLFVIVTPQGEQRSKQLLMYDGRLEQSKLIRAIDLEWQPPPGNTTNVDQDSYRLAFAARLNVLLISSAESFVVKRYNVGEQSGAVEGNHGEDPGRGVLPVQLGPAAVASDRLGNVYALNAVSMTISQIPNTFVQGKTYVVMGALASYHTAMLAAYIDLLAALLQQIKDCACDHLLVKCATPDGKPLHLARIDIRGGEIYNICNFARRHYVHTFPAVEYWLSMVPIVPVIAKLVGDACCQPIVDLIRRAAPAGEATHATVVPITGALRAMTFAQDFDVQTQLKPQITDRLGTFGSIAKAFVARGGAPMSAVPVPPKPAPLSVRPYFGRPATAVTAVLAQSQIHVTGTEPLAIGGQTRDMLLAPTLLHPNDTVTLVVDDQQNVIGYRLAAAQSVSLAQLTAELAKRDEHIAQLNGTIDGVRASQAQALQTRDVQIAELGRRLDVLSRPTPPIR